MSIVGAIHASWSETVRKGWAAELRSAVQKRDWKAVEALLKKLETPTFFE